jgi:hypothetical protein
MSPFLTSGFLRCFQDFMKIYSPGLDHKQFIFMQFEITMLAFNSKESAANSYLILTVNSKAIHHMYTHVLSQYSTCRHLG